MGIENVSRPMAENFAVLSKLMEGGYIGRMKPINRFLTPLCLWPAKTSKFQEAPKEVKKKFGFRMFSTYAFFFGPFAFTQTKLAKGYFILFSFYSFFICLLPPDLPGVRIFYYAFNLFMSQVFVYSRFNQSLSGCPRNRSVFSIVCLGFIWLFLSVMPGTIVASLLYPET